jgi:VWFA-related protein
MLRQMPATTASLGNLPSLVRHARVRAAGTMVVVLLLCLAGRATGDGALTTADLVRFLRAGISEHTILAELRERGFGEALDETREAELRAAGASETLVVAVRNVAPAAKSPAPQAAPPAPVRPFGEAPTFAARTRTVRVPVSVLDKAGQSVLGLKSTDFQVSDEGKRQAVTLFSAERRPLRIALALDISRSMDNKIRQVGAALSHFIGLLEPTDEILVITFNDRVEVAQDFTSDRDQLARVLDVLEPSGGTALYDAAYTAIEKVAALPAESKAVVLVTDGVDTASATTFGTLCEFARRSEVPVFSMGLDAGEVHPYASHPQGHHGGGGGGGGRGGWPGGPGGGGGSWPGGGGGGGGWPGGGGGSGGGRGGGPGGGHHSGGRHPAFDAKPLEELADETGGRAVIVTGLEHYTPGTDDAPGSGPLKTAVESIAETLRYRYLLGYEPPPAKREWRTIHVDVDRSEATARTRRGYYAGD